MTLDVYRGPKTTMQQQQQQIKKYNFENSDILGQNMAQIIQGS